MTEQFYKYAIIILWAAYIGIRVPFEGRYRENKKTRKEGVAAERFIIVLLGLTILLLPMIWALTSYLDQFRLFFHPAIRNAGIVLAVVSLVYFFQIHKALGDNWSPGLEIQKKHALVVAGPYKRIRHPMYLQILLWTLSQSLILSNFIAGFAGIAGWFLFYWWQVPREEKMLKDHFGNAYTDYMKKTNRIIPVNFNQKNK